MEAAGKRYIVHGSRSTEIKLWCIADIHWMARACAEDKIRKDIALIRDDPYSFWIGGGDYADFIGYSDRRFDADAVADWVPVGKLSQLGQAAVEGVRDLFWPIRDKCLGLLLGNHEKQYQQKLQQENLHGWLCTELGVENLQYSCLLDLVFRRKAGIKRPFLTRELPEGGGTAEGFRIFCHHGAGYAQTPGGKLNRLVAFMQRFDADIYFCGHVHDRVGRRIARLGADAKCTTLTQQIRLGIITGAYLKTYSQGVTTYAEQRGYEPVTLGAAWVKIKPETRELSAEI